MALDCEKFSKLIPANTLKLLYDVLPDLNYYVAKNNILKADNKSSVYNISTEYIKLVLILLNGFRDIEEYNNLFGVLQLTDYTFKNKDKENEDKKKQSEFKKFYDEHTYLFDLYDDEIDYISLTPLKFMYLHLKKFGSYDRESLGNVVGTRFI